MKRKDILFFTITIFIFVCAWVIFSVFHNAKTSTLSDQLNVQIQPIDPHFDSKTMSSLKSRTQIQDYYASDTSLSPTQTQIPLANTALVISPTKSASSSGGTKP